MFSCPQLKKRLQEFEARWFFQQLIIGLDYCHKVSKAMSVPCLDLLQSREKSMARTSLRQNAWSYQLEEETWDLVPDGMVKNLASQSSTLSIRQRQAAYDCCPDLSRNSALKKAGCFG